MGLIKHSQRKAPSHELATNSFKWRAMNDYNSLTLEIRNTTSINKFKKLAKKWIEWTYSTVEIMISSLYLNV